MWCHLYFLYPPPKRVGVSTVSTVYSPFSALQPCSPASLPEQGRTAHTLYIMLEASAWISLKRAWILSTAKRLYTNSQRQRTQKHEEDILQTSSHCAWNFFVQYNCQLYHSCCLQKHNARCQQFPLPRWRLTQQHLGLWLVGKACCVRGMRHGWQGFVTEMDNFYLYFNKSIEILYIFAKSLPLLKAPRGKRRGWHIIHKRRYWTLWFWRIWTSQLQLSVKNKATRTSHGMFYIQPSLGICLSLAIFLWRCFIYSSAWGFQRCSFRQIGAMRRPRYVERASDWLHVFFVYIW